ncbi:unnamed protein product [Ostreobium quekettii]|uniref:Uncharacterized protein n=1 Tax=Ostreobium quekettii TaxID=121088 RepID=A0A8S1IXT5_9CHLO|nr:unnamed protein product [Ostreobium quekettii]
MIWRLHVRQDPLPSRILQNPFQTLEVCSIERLLLSLSQQQTAQRESQNWPSAEKLGSWWHRFNACGTGLMHVAKGQLSLQELDAMTDHLCPFGSRQPGSIRQQQHMDGRNWRICN